ncbi:MAG: hypothetical protein WA743_07920, partial [Pseudolabrys sp.]
CQGASTDAPRRSERKDRAAMTSKNTSTAQTLLVGDFCNKICHKQMSKLHAIFILASLRGIV